MNTFVKSTILALALVSQAAVSSYGQEKTDTNSNSLGDIARHLNAEKAKEPKPVKVFTNDNLLGSENDVSTLGPITKENKSTTPAPEGSGTKAQHHDEEYYRSQMSALKGTLETHQRELDVLQQKLGQNQVQYYNDPNKSLQQQYSRDDINKLTTDIDAKKQQVADDNKAIDDLSDQLRHVGGDPGWLR
jgi:parvulin-like peptidyl-prolyl isomerase